MVKKSKPAKTVKRAVKKLPVGPDKLKDPLWAIAVELAQIR